MAVADESHKNKHHLDGLRGHAESCALTSPRMYNAASHALACFCCQGTFCCSEQEEGGSGKESCQKKSPPQVLSVAWLASTQFFAVYHSLSTKVDTAHSYLRNMKLCFELGLV